MPDDELSVAELIEQWLDETHREAAEDIWTGRPAFGWWSEPLCDWPQETSDAQTPDVQ